MLLQSRPSHPLKRDGRDIFVFECEVILSFTNRSVPELIRVWHGRGELHLAPCALSGERPAEGRAAITRLTLSRMNLPAAA